LQKMRYGTVTETSRSGMSEKRIRVAGEGLGLLTR
jgi:hypothetical protein